MKYARKQEVIPVQEPMWLIEQTPPDLRTPEQWQTIRANEAYARRQQERDDAENARRRATYDPDLVEAWEAAEIADVKPGTIRVWTHRGKLDVVDYADDGFGQRVARYRRDDVEALAR